MTSPPKTDGSGWGFRQLSTYLPMSTGYLLFLTSFLSLSSFCLLVVSPEFLAEVYTYSDPLHIRWYIPIIDNFERAMVADGLSSHSIHRFIVAVEIGWYCLIGFSIFPILFAADFLRCSVETADRVEWQFRLRDQKHAILSIVVPSVGLTLLYFGSVFLGNSKKIYRSDGSILVLALIFWTVMMLLALATWGWAPRTIRRLGPTVGRQPTSSNEGPPAV